MCIRLLVPYFNPRSREGSDHLRRRTFQFRLISIHAPAKGATIVISVFSVVFVISIHAPAKGATLFQHKEHRVHVISIHAPAKGATAILAKIQLKISAKINNFFFFYTIFPLYNLLLIHKIHFICIFFWCESPGIFMSAPDSHPTSAAFKHFCHNINVSSTAIPLSTPMCSTFV